MDGALRHHQSGHLPEAENLYRQVLAHEPYHAEALHLLGVIAYQNCRMDVAMDLIQKAIVQKPQVSEFHSNLGLVLAAVGKLEGAIVAYQRALSLQPNSVEVLNNLGNVLKDKRQIPEAVAIFERALKLQPNSPITHNNLGSVYHAGNKLEAAVASYQRALQLVPDYADALNNLGTTLETLGRKDEAMRALDRAIQIRPDFADAYYNLGNALRNSGKKPEAIAAYRKALGIRPDFPEACNNLGNLLHGKGEQGMEEAIALFRKAIALRPTFADAYRNLGLAMIESGKEEHACCYLEKVLSLRPDDAETWNSLGTAYFGSGRLTKAVEAFAKADALKPGMAKVHSNLGNVYKEMGDLDRAIASYERAMACDPEMASIASNRLCTLQNHPGYDRAHLFAEQRKFNQQYALPQAKFIRPHGNDRSPDRRLKIGYVSADFRDHVAGFNLLPVLWQRDRGAFEVICYNNRLHNDAVTAKFRAASDGWRTIEGEDDDAVAQMIHDDQIDILMDLSLHSGGNRLPLFARKPAPVQATFIGYPGSTGLDAMDYRLTDPYLDPSGETDQYYSEQSIRLPESFWCYDPEAMQVGGYPISPLPAIKSGAITFGCLNNFCKVNDGVLELWARVLREVPNSQLLLLVPGGVTRERVTDKFQREGIDLVRLRFVQRQMRPDYLKTYEQIDVGLDTLPYNGHTTSLDSLWMGVPVVTLIGQTVVGRAGWSQLCNLGLKELAAKNGDEFVQIASKLAKDTQRLSELRQGLRQRMKDSPLCNARRFAQNVETAYRQMWQKWCATSKVVG
jgi:predicted O-linked N-acetylglucosamine transferase (SPINDLY family)